MRRLMAVMATVAVAAIGIGAGGPASATPATCAGAWTIVPSPSPGTNIQSLLSVDALSSTNAYAVGFAGYQDAGGNFAESPLLVHWDGAEWSVGLRPRGEQGALADVDAITDHDVWTVGHSGLDSLDYRPLTMHYDGRRWRSVPNPDVVQGYLLGVDAVASNDVWAAGITIGTFDTLIEHWDGSSWTLVDHPSPRSDYVAFGAMDARASDDVWIVGSYLDGSGISRTLAEHWDGSAWSVVATPNPGAQGSALTSVTAVDRNDVWATGTVTVGPARSRALVLHWDGHAWTVVTPQAAGRTYGFDGGAAGGPIDLWAVGFWSNSPDGGLRTLVEHSDGTGFTQMTTPNVNDLDNRLLAAAVSPDGDAWAVGFYQDVSRNQTLTMHWCP